MPYATKRNYRRRYGRRPARTRKSAAIPRKKKTTRTYVRSNALANARQDRAISRLYKLRYGPVQRSLQLSDTTFTINASQPICFDCADFTSQRTRNGVTVNGCIVWQVSTLGTAIGQAGHFSTAPLANNALWRFSNDDIVDGGRYKPLYATYIVEVSGRKNLDSTHIQMDLFAQKAGFNKYSYPTSGMSAYQRFMPDALVNLTSMCFENEFNPSLFKRYKRQRMLINSATFGETDGTGEYTGSTGVTSNIKYFKFTVKPKKARQQLEPSPDIPGKLEAEAGQTLYGAYGSINVDPRTPLWCMFSTTDRTALDGDSVNIKIRRHVVWRDINGGTFTM